ncbi:hypothetical protein KJ909_04290, partial [Patescibacteria group bacterium]|nr:hypothetical protein [Patescibacteria group bacterium]
MKKYILGLSVFCFLFLGFLNPVHAMGLGEVESATGVDIVYSGSEQNLNINQVLPGAYEIRASAFACTPGTPNCEPDRYEINLPKKVDHIFGLGRQIGAYQVEVADFLDTSFGNGHIFTPNSKNADGTPTNLDFFEVDTSRIRTPVFVLPSEKLLVAYIQPAVKRLRLSRTSNSTQMVLKKVEAYPIVSEERPGSLLIIKASGITELYNIYYQSLRQLNFYFKTPHYKIFGLNWETFDEFGCFTNRAKVDRAVTHFEEKGLKLSTVTIGSGYWGDAIDPHGNVAVENLIGCGTVESDYPGTESLSVSQTKYGGLQGITGFFNTLLSKGIYPIIGMRARLQVGVKNPDRSWRFDTPGMVDKAFRDAGFTGNLFLDNGHEFYYQNTGRFKMLDLYNPAIFSTWVDLIKNAYGPFKGVKEDEMYFSDQKQNNTRPNEVNMLDGWASKTFPIYNQKFNDDFIIMGNGSWFSAGSDAQYTIGRMGSAQTFHLPYLAKGGDEIKFYHDAALSQVVSGYPNPAIGAGGFFGWPDVESGNKDRTLESKYELPYLRYIKLNTFYPIANYSVGFWHLPEPLQTATVFFMKLRNRLHQYVYDQATQTATDGIPRSMQPLFMAYPNDPKSYDMYTYNDDPTKPFGEYMFGNALLVRPVFMTTNTVSVYFPPGKWKPFLMPGPTIEGGDYRNYTLTHINDYPVFLKEGEILIIGDPDTTKSTLYAYVFLESPGITQSSVYQFHDHITGTKYNLRAVKDGSVYKLINTATNQWVTMTDDAYGKGFKIAEITSLVGGSVPGDLNGDANGDTKVDGVDYVIWLNHYGQTISGGVAVGDFNKSGKIDGVDYV